MRVYLPVRLFGRASRILPSVKRFGRSIARHTPAVRPAMAVDVILEIRNDDVHPHHQTGQYRVERNLSFALHRVHQVGLPPMSPPLGKAQQAAQFFHGHAPFSPYGLKHHLIQRLCIFILRIPARTSPVHQVGQPFKADISRLLIIELAVGTMSLTDDRTFPFPRSFFLIREPILPCRPLLDGETGNAAPEERQEAQLQHLTFHIFSRTYLVFVAHTLSSVFKTQINADFRR